MSVELVLMLVLMLVFETESKLNKNRKTQKERGTISGPLRW